MSYLTQTSLQGRSLDGISWNAAAEKASWAHGRGEGVHVCASCVGWVGLPGTSKSQLSVNRTFFSFRHYSEKLFFFFVILMAQTYCAGTPRQDAENSTC